MATKTKLEQAIENQVQELCEAQRELVKSQFATYKWNKRRIAQIEELLYLMERRDKSPDPKARKALMTERHQLTTDNVSISSKLFMQLKDTGKKSDELESFLKKGDR